MTKENYIKFRCSDDFKNLVEQQAKERGMTVSSYIKHLIRKDVDIMRVVSNCFITEEMENTIWNYNLNYNIPEGENLHDFEKRILEFLEDIKKKYADKTVLIVAHGGVAKIIKAHLYGMPESKNLSEIKMQNCEIIEADI